MSGILAPLTARPDWLRRTLTAGLTIVALDLGGYLALGWYIYDRFTADHPRCESPYMEGRNELNARFAARADR